MYTTLHSASFLSSYSNKRNFIMLTVVIVIIPFVTTSSEILLII